VHGLKETERTSLARVLQSSLLPYTHYTHGLPAKVAVEAHHLHLDTLPILPSHSGRACTLGHLNWPQHCSWQNLDHGGPDGMVWYGH